MHAAWHRPTRAYPRQVDFLTVYNKAASLGAKFNPDAYLHPVEMDVKRL
jgi:hypothetical protein